MQGFERTDNTPGGGRNVTSGSGGAAAGSAPPSPISPSSPSGGASPALHFFHGNNNNNNNNNNQRPPRQSQPQQQQSNQEQEQPSDVVSSPLRAPLTPRRSLSPRRRAAIADAFDAVKLDDENALYTCLTGKQSGKSQNSTTTTAINDRVDPNAVEPRNPKQTTLLHWAAYLGSHGCFDLLLQCPGINLCPRESDNKTPLHYAAFQGHSDMIASLLDLGVEPCEPDALGQTPCHLARIAGREDIARMFPNYQEVVDQSISQPVHSDTSFVPGAGNDDNNGYDYFDEFQQQHHQQQSSSSRSRQRRQHNQQPQQTDQSVMTSSSYDTAATGTSPHLMPRARSVSMEGGVAANAFVNQRGFQQQQQQRFAASQQASSPPQQQQSRNSAGTTSVVNISAAVHRDILGPEEEITTTRVAVEGEPEQQEDPALRQDSEEMRRLAEDEENLAQMERELEEEEAAHRVSQAQLVWIERVREIARVQNGLSDGQLSERLWEVVSSIEGPLLSSDTEIERRGIEQLRSVTGKLEQTVIQRRMESRGVPVVMFRWNPGAAVMFNNKQQEQQQQQSQLQQQQRQGASPVTFQQNELSPLSPNNSSLNGGGNLAAGRHQPPQQQHLSAGNSRSVSGEVPGLRSVAPILGRRAGATTSASVASSHQRQYRQYSQNGHNELSPPARLLSGTQQPEPEPRDPAAQPIPQQQQQQWKLTNTVPRFAAAPVAAPVMVAPRK